MNHQASAPDNSISSDERASAPVKVMIVDDHEMVALGLAALLEDEADVRVCASVGSVKEAIEAVDRFRPDVVLMDYRLPDGTGVDAAIEIGKRPDPPGIIMITSVVDRRVLNQALDAGCCGFVSKNADRRDLVDAIHAGAQHDSYFTRDVLKHLVHLKRFDTVERDELTQREIDVLQATANGRSPDEIADELFLSAHTVKNHLRHAMSKLDAHTKLDAVVKAIRSRIISIDE